MHGRFVLIVSSFFCSGMIAIEALLFSKIIEMVLDASFPAVAIGIWLVLIGVHAITVRIIAQKQQLHIQKTRTEMLLSVFQSERDSVSAANAAKVCQDDVEKVETYVLATLPNGVLDLLMLVVYSIYMYGMNSLFCIWILGIGLLRCIVPLFMNRFFSHQYETTMRMEEDIANFYYTLISRFTKAWFFQTQYFTKRLKAKYDPYYQVGKQSEKAAQFENAIQNLFDVLSQFGLCFFGILLIGQKQLTYPVMLSMLVLSQMVYGMLKSLCDAMRDYSLYKVSQKRIQELVKQKDTRKQRFDMQQIEMDCKPDFLPYRFVCTMPQRGLVVVKGKNGSGKSTLLKMLLNIETGYEGQILVDGEDVRGLQMSSLCAYAAQNSVVLDLRAEELWAGYAQQEIERYQNLFAFSKELAQQNMLMLSSGQQKKVQLIQVFLSQKRILLMDEPETSLDEESRNQLLTCIQDYPGLVIVATNTTMYDAMKTMEVKVYEEH